MTLRAENPDVPIHSLSRVGSTALFGELVAPPHQSRARKIDQKGSFLLKAWIARQH